MITFTIHLAIGIEIIYMNRWRSGGISRSPMRAPEFILRVYFPPSSIPTAGHSGQHAYSGRHIHVLPDADLLFGRQPSSPI
jgi:hypothetical protein